MAQEEENKTKRYIISVGTEFGHVGVSASTAEEAIELVTELSDFKKKVEEKLTAIKFLEAAPAAPTPKKELEGIVGYIMGGKPKFLVSLEPLRRKERVGLVLYVMDPRPVSSSEVAGIISVEWKPMNSKTASAYLTSAMRDLVYSTDKGYLLTGKGKSWIKNEVLPKIKEP